MEKRVMFDSEVTEIARIVFPAEDIRSAKKKVRDAAQHAEKIGGLVIERQQGQRESKPRLYVYESDFREWAASKWPELRSHFQIPIVGSLTVVLPIPRFAGHLIQIPTDHDELVRQFVAATDSLMHCQKELVDCKEQLKLLERAAAMRQEEDDLERQRRIEAGKSGGRGHRRF